jgi:hypothetical protein
MKTTIHVQQSKEHKLLGAPDDATTYVIFMPYNVAIRD